MFFSIYLLLKGKIRKQDKQNWRQSHTQTQRVFNTKITFKEHFKTYKWMYMANSSINLFQITSVECIILNKI